MKALNNSSDALSTREAEGLAEGNGRLADRGIEDDSAFILFDAAHSSIGFSDGGFSLLRRGWASKMFRSGTETDETGRQLPQDWKPFQQAYNERQRISATRS